MEPRGAAFLLRLTSPVHKEPRCPLVCLKNQSGKTTNHGAISFAFRHLLPLFFLKKGYQTAVCTGENCFFFLTDWPFLQSSFSDGLSLNEGPSATEVKARRGVRYPWNNKTAPKTLAHGKRR